MRDTWPDIAAAYDVAAADYAELFGAELAGKPFDRELLDRFAASAAGGGPVWDAGCGAAGHITRYLADRGVAAAGCDVSPGVVTEAARRQPGLEFRVADLRELPVPDGALAGIVAFYSVIHLPRPEIPAALAEFRRALGPGGSLLLAMHAPSAAIADRVSERGELIATEAFGHPVEVRATLVTLAELTGLAEAAGLAVAWDHERDPYPDELPSRRVYLWARRTA